MSMSLNGEPTVIPSFEHLLHAHVTYMAAKGLSETTVWAAQRALRAANQAIAAGLLAAYPEEIAAWLANPRWSASTKATYRQHLRRFGAWAADPEDPWLSYDPTRNLPRPRVPRGVPRPALDSQVHIAITQTPWPWRLHCLLAGYEGLRCIEVARLDRDDVTEQLTYVHGKGGRKASVPTHPLVWAAVRDLPAGRLTAMPNGAPATAGWVSLSTRRQLERLGVHLSMHRLRHWFGTTIQRQYRDLRVTQEMLRHVSPASTAVYTEVSEAAKWEALRCLPDLSGPADGDEDGERDHR